MRDNMPHGVGLELCGFFLGQCVDVQPMNHPLDLGFDPSVAMQGQIHTARDQGFVIHPGHGGQHLLLAWIRADCGGCVEIIFCHGGGNRRGQ
jgi:hypothetical protein